MATQKKTTKSSPKKKSPVKNKPKKKIQKKIETKTSSKRFSYSTIIIVIIVLAIFFYFNKSNKTAVTNQLESQETDIITQIQNQVSGDSEHLDGKELSFYYPTANLSNGGIVEHFAYSLDYNEEYEQADWVFYELTKEEVLNKKVPRKDKFAKDPTSTISSSLANDYYKSGYDRGHLCPAADNRWSQQAMDESFYMSNMSPQHPDLNRKIWAELEEQVREWAVENDKIYIATGPILEDGFRAKTGKSNVAIPNYFYKVVADLSGDEIKGLGFIFANGENNGELKYYATSIDMVEERTKIDFFYKLNDELEKKIETDYILEDWFK